MKVKFSDILSANESLTKLSQERLPVSESLTLARLIKKLNDEMSFFNGQREKLLIQYAEKSDDEGGYLVPKENITQFKKDFDELLNSEVETETEKIKITLQKDSRIEPATVLGCEIFCEFEEEK